MRYCNVNTSVSSEHHSQTSGSNTESPITANFFMLMFRSLVSGSLWASLLVWLHVIRGEPELAKNESGHIWYVCNYNSNRVYTSSLGEITRIFLQHREKLPPCPTWSNCSHVKEVFKPLIVLYLVQFPFHDFRNLLHAANYSLKVVWTNI